MTNETKAFTEFFNANQTELNNVRVSAIARKIDRKDKSENAKRFFSMNAKDVNRTLTTIEGFIANLTNEIRTKGKGNFAKTFVAKAFANVTNLDNADSVTKVITSVCRTLQIDVANVDPAKALSALKNAVKVMSNRHGGAIDAKLGSLTGKAKDLYSGKEYDALCKVTLAKAKANVA